MQMLALICEKQTSILLNTDIHYFSDKNLCCFNGDT